PAANANGANYASFTFQVQDDGGVLNGGVDLDATARTMTINVTPVNQSLQVGIDIKPGDSHNQININSDATIEVAILSSKSFNAMSVDVSSLRFGETGTENSLNRSHGSPVFTYRDVNHDGRLDLVVQFETDRTGLQSGDTVGVLTGRLLNGQQFTGTDAVDIQSPHGNAHGGQNQDDNDRDHCRGH